MPRSMSPELLSRFEPVAREQLKQVVTNRVSQFFTADSLRVDGNDPLVVTFLYAPRRDATMLDPTPLATRWEAGSLLAQAQARHQQTSQSFRNYRPLVKQARLMSFRRFGNSRNVEVSALALCP